MLCCLYECISVQFWLLCCIYECISVQFWLLCCLYECISVQFWLLCWLSNLCTIWLIIFLFYAIEFGYCFCKCYHKSGKGTTSVLTLSCPLQRGHLLVCEISAASVIQFSQKMCLQAGIWTGLKKTVRQTAHKWSSWTVSFAYIISLFWLIVLIIQNKSI